MNQAVGRQFPNGAHNALFHAKIKLTGDRKHGTFSGANFEQASEIVAGL